MSFFKNVISSIAALLICIDMNAQKIIDAEGLRADQDWNISGSISYLTDSLGMDVNTALVQPEEKWISNNGKLSFYKSISKNTYWLRFHITIEHPTTAIYYLILSNKGINETELFVSKKGETKSLGKTGDHFPFFQRPYPSTSFSFPLELKRGDTLSCYLYCNKKNENLNLKLRLIPEKIFKEKENTSQTFIGLFLGVLMMAFIVSLIMLFIFRDKLNFWYAIYIILVVNILLVYDGLDFQWLYPNLPFFASISRFVASSLTLGMMMHVMQLFCNQLPSNSKFFQSVQFLKIIIFLMVPATFIIYKYFPHETVKRYHFMLFLLEQVAGVLLVIISCTEKIIQRYKPALFYLSAVILILYSGITGIMLEMGIVHKNADTPNLLQFSFIVEVILISIGVLYKYDLIKVKNQMLTAELASLKLSSVKQMLQIQREEQMRIAEDLHDLMGARLAAVKFKVADLDGQKDNKEEILKVIDELSQSSRMIAHNLRPAELNQNDFSDVIAMYLTRLNMDQEIRFEFIQLGNPVALRTDLEFALYKIITELLTNILKHSKASEATVQLNFLDSNLELIVEDNGKGMVTEDQDGMGLKNVRKRVALLHGKIHIDSIPGNTTFILQFPLNP